MIGEAIKRTKERLEKVKKQRSTQRRQRERRDTFSISLVGYTNAGKSSLFNGLVKARAYAADQLFATLDTTTRQLYLGEASRSVSLSDTVGFIRDLPHGLVDAFAATLQEAADADLLLHVVDASSPALEEQITEVERVLGPRDMDGLHVVVSAGGTREPIDAVRVVANRSSGKQGYAFAAEALGRGARVTLVSTVELPVPSGASIRPVETAAQMQ
eukprot:gene34685-57502_t